VAPILTHAVEIWTFFYERNKYNPDKQNEVLKIVVGKTRHSKL